MVPCGHCYPRIQLLSLDLSFLISLHYRDRPTERSDNRLFEDATALLTLYFSSQSSGERCFVNSDMSPSASPVLSVWVSKSQLTNPLI